MLRFPNPSAPPYIIPVEDSQTPGRRKLYPSRSNDDEDEEGSSSDGTEEISSSSDDDTEEEEEKKKKSGSVRKNKKKTRRRSQEKKRQHAASHLEAKVVTLVVKLPAVGLRYVSVSENTQVSEHPVFYILYNVQHHGQVVSFHLVPFSTTSSSSSGGVHCATHVSNNNNNNNSNKDGPVWLRSGGPLATAPLRFVTNLFHLSPTGAFCTGPTRIACWNPKSWHETEVPSDLAFTEIHRHTSTLEIGAVYPSVQWDHRATRPRHTFYLETQPDSSLLVVPPLLVVPQQQQQQQQQPLPSSSLLGGTALPPHFSSFAQSSYPHTPTTSLCAPALRSRIAPSSELFPSVVYDDEDDDGDEDDTVVHHRRSSSIKKCTQSRTKTRMRRYQRPHDNENETQKKRKGKSHTKEQEEKEKRASSSERQLLRKWKIAGQPEPDSVWVLTRRQQIEYATVIFVVGFFLGIALYHWRPRRPSRY